MSQKVKVIPEFHHDGRQRRVFMFPRNVSIMLEQLFYSMEAGQVTEEDLRGWLVGNDWELALCGPPYATKEETKRLADSWYGNDEEERILEMAHGAES